MNTEQRIDYIKQLNGFERWLESHYLPSAAQLLYYKLLSINNMAGGTRQIHDNSVAEKLSKIAGQLVWEKEYYHKLYGYENDPAREAFRKRYGRSYL